MTTNILIIIGILALILIGFLAVLILRLLKSRADSQQDSQSMLMLQQQLRDLTSTVDLRLNESNLNMQNSIQTQFGESQRVIRDTNEQLVKHLTEVSKGVAENSEATRNVMSVTAQLQNLEKVLKHQKQRGSLGEASLELALANMLPASSYKLQYLFDGGECVDAVIMTKEGFICVDAKFSLDNYNRLLDEDDKERREPLEREFKNDLKRRIDETAKYIRPNEGTLPFAFMYIPAEGIYYDLLVNEVGSMKVNTRSLIDYAYKDKNVIIVSPTTFVAYLQSVLYGFRAFKIEESAKQIGKQVEELSRHIKAYDEYFKKVGNSLSTTVNHYNSASKELKKIDKDVYKISGAETGIDKLQLDRPDVEI